MVEEAARALAMLPALGHIMTALLSQITGRR
jgi:hypothetical protein